MSFGTNIDKAIAEYGQWDQFSNLLDGIGVVYYGDKVKCNLGVYNCGKLKTGLIIYKSFYGYTANLMVQYKTGRVITASFYFDEDK